ncbi:MAG TPA: c-type cytochrome [Burkholderiaceae bacterium]|nr:c-type cytochrome [Burkholderiaceae bacterium]
MPRTPSLRSVLLVSALAAAAVPASARTKSGAEVYEQVCRACHEAGTLGAPRFGDAKAWKPLIAEGQRELFRTSIKGIRKMPPKGGQPALADVEVRRAVVYMANAGGARWTEPAR